MEGKMTTTFGKILTAISTGVLWGNTAFASAIGDGADAARKGNESSLSGSLNVSFASIANLLIYITGAIAVIVIIIGGLRYVISQGNSDQVKQAKDTLLYGVIGVVVAILAY